MPGMEMFLFEVTEMEIYENESEVLTYFVSR